MGVFTMGMTLCKNRTDYDDRPDKFRPEHLPIFPSLWTTKYKGFMRTPLVSKNTIIGIRKKKNLFHGIFSGPGLLRRGPDHETGGGVTQG